MCGADDYHRGFAPVLANKEETMPKRIPITTAKEVAEKHDLKQVLLIGWDGERVHVVTYGATKEDCAKAAEAQNFWTGKIREFSFRGDT